MHNIIHNILLEYYVASYALYAYSLLSFITTRVHTSMYVLLGRKPMQASPLIPTPPALSP